LDVAILHVHDEHPDEPWRVKAEKILSTEAYKKHYPLTTMKPRFFWQRWWYLKENNITIEELVDFVNQGADPKSSNPYKNALSCTELRTRKRDEQTDVYGSEEDSSLTEFSEEDSGADEDNYVEKDTDGEDDCDDNEERLEALTKAFDESDVSDLTELVSDQEGSALRSTARPASGPAPKPTS
jgi:hypothetical protein